jgi:hypothetical protein
MVRYSHTLRGQEAEAVKSLPDLSLSDDQAQDAGADSRPELTPQLTPRSTPPAFLTRPCLSSLGTSQGAEVGKAKGRKRLQSRKLGTKEDGLAADVIEGLGIRPTGFELSLFPRQKRRFPKRAAQNPAHPAHKTPRWTPTWF